MVVKLVGVLNITPDSFSDGGDYDNPQEALRRADVLFAEGADIIDVGGEATNPWATPISLYEEWQRLEVIIPSLIARYPGKISIDTRRPEIVEHAAQYGNFFVNDVTTFINPAMIRVVAKFGLKVIASHLPLRANGNILLAHEKIKLDDVDQVKSELLEQKNKLITAGLSDRDIILDPGIGFGKSMQLNWELLEFAKYLPKESVLIGYSRKRFLSTDPQTGKEVTGVDRYGMLRNLEAAKIAINSGAAYLRVHDVAPHKKLIKELLDASA